MSTVIEYAKSLKKLINVETISVTEKDNLEKFERLHNVLKEEFPSVLNKCQIENFNGNLLIKWAGSDSSLKPILFMNHQDVVEATSNWNCDPFAGEIIGSRLYGRGTLDDKGGLWAMIMAAEELITEGYIPETDIYFVSGINEETTGEGSKYISDILKERNIHFSFVLDEGGMIIDNPIVNSPHKFAMIGVGEKAAVDIKISAKAKPGHSSVPSKNGAIVKLSKFIKDADKIKFKKHLNSTCIETLKICGRDDTSIVGKLLTHVDTFRFIFEKIISRFNSSINAISSTTIAFTMLKGSDGRNVLPDTATLIINMRASHHEGIENSIRKIKKLADKHGLEVEILDPGCESGISSIDNVQYNVLKGTITNLFPDVLVAPYIMNGASDSRFMSVVSDNIYRFLPFSIDEQQYESIHGDNENIDINDLPKAVSFYKELMKKGKELNG